MAAVGWGRVHPGSQPEGRGPAAVLAARSSRAGLDWAAVSVLRAEVAGLLGDALGRPPAPACPPRTPKLSARCDHCTDNYTIQSPPESLSRCQSREAGFRTAAIPASRASLINRVNTRLPKKPGWQGQDLADVELGEGGAGELSLPPLTSSKRPQSSSLSPLT